jgi:hypothetical protein
MAYADAQIADIPTLADFVARWLQNLRDWCPRCQGLGRETPQSAGDERIVCGRCEGLLWVSVIDVERLLEAISRFGPLEVELKYGEQQSRKCVLRMDGEYLGEDDSTVGAVYRAAANLVASMLEKGILKDTPFDETGH